MLLIQKIINLIRWLAPFILGSQIREFKPRKAYPGAMIEISGLNFAPQRKYNQVKVGGKMARVVSASPTKLKVITSLETITGSVEVKVGLFTSKGPHDFTVLPYPQPGSGMDGPPAITTGSGRGEPGDVPSTGTLNVLSVLVNPSDRLPADPKATRNTVIDAWDNVRTFYEQASYSQLDVDVDLTTNWKTLTGDFSTYISTADQNIYESLKPRLLAEAAQAAVDEGYDLNDYDVMACVMNLNGYKIRAWGGWSQQVFQYNDGAGTNINITLGATRFCEL